MKKSPLALLITLGLLQTPSVFAATAPLDLVTPVSDYKIYVTENVDKLVTDTTQFTDAIKKGDLATANKADDFTGFHRLEYALFSQNTTKDQAVFADKLLADVKDLQSRIADMTFPPEKVVGGAAALMEEVAATKLSGEEDRYSHTDLYDFQGNVDGSKKIVDLFKPQLEKSDKAFVAKVDKNFATVEKILAKYKTKDGGYETYDKVKENDRKALTGPINTLAEDLSQMRGKLGLN